MTDQYWTMLTHLGLLAGIVMIIWRQGKASQRSEDTQSRIEKKVDGIITTYNTGHTALVERVNEHEVRIGVVEHIVNRNHAPNQRP